MLGYICEFSFSLWASSEIYDGGRDCIPLCLGIAREARYAVRGLRSFCKVLNFTDLETIKAMCVRRGRRDGSVKPPSAHVSKRSWLVGFL